jgi:imidazolonepropionase-like amidohydrolase
MPHLLAFSSFVATREEIRTSRLTGVTHVVSRMLGGTIPCQAAIMHMAGWNAEDMEITRHGPVMLSLPSEGSLHYSDDERFQTPAYSTTRRGLDRRMIDVRQLLTDARAYVKTTAVSSPRDQASFVPDARLEALVPVIKGERVVMIEAFNHGDIRNAVAFAEEEKLNYVIVGATDAWRMADYLKAHKTRVVLGPTQGLPLGEDDPIDAVYRTPAILQQAGVPFALSTGTKRMFDSELRHLPFEAGNAVAFGLPYDAALRSVTLTPAEFLGVADRLGTIEKGKIANLVVTDGDVFEYRTRVKYLFINGKPVSLQSRDSEEYEKYRRR